MITAFRYQYLLLLFCCSILSSCSNDEKTSSTNNIGVDTPKQELRINLTHKINKLLPEHLPDNQEKDISSQLYEGLVKYNSENQSIVPCIAQSFSIDSTQKIYRFKLKTEVYYHSENNKKKIVRAYDIATCFINRLKSNDKNQYNELLRYTLLGPERKVAPEDAIHVIDALTIEIKSLEPSPIMLHLLASSAGYIYTYENEEIKTKGIKNLPIGTGPFMIQKIESEYVMLSKNIHYHMFDQEGNRLPYLDKIEWVFFENRSNELNAFQNNKLDIIHHPGSDLYRYITDASQHIGPLSDHTIIENKLAEKTLLMMCYPHTDITYQHNKYLFNYIDLTINKSQYLYENINYNLIPSFLKEYPYKKLKYTDQYPDSVKTLLTDYPEIKATIATYFKSISLSTANSEMVFFARDFKDLIKSDFAIEIQEIHPTNFYNDIYKNKPSYFIYKSSAEIKDAIIFPWLFSKYNKAAICTCNHPDFDKTFVEGLKKKKNSIRYEHIADAEQLLYNQNLYFPLQEQKKYTILHAFIKNMRFNSLNYWDLRTVKLVYPEKAKLIK